MWEDAPSSLYCCMLSLCCSQSFQKRLAAFLRRPVPSKANTQSTLCYLDLMAAESRAALMARMKRAGLWTCSVTRGETLTERGKRWRSAHPWLHSSCHRPTSSRITWNPNWFFFPFFPSFKQVKRKTSNIWWPQGGAKVERDKANTQTVIFLSEKRQQSFCNFKFL